METPSPPLYTPSAAAAHQSLGAFQLSNNSSYTLATIPGNEPSSTPSTRPNSPRPTGHERTRLLNASSSTTSSYGMHIPPAPPSSSTSRRVLFNACLKMAALFVISTAVLGGTLWLALPALEEADRPFLRIPKSFAQLQELNGLLKKYRDIYPYRIVVCYVTTYLFLQAFSLPGSMYLSILGGAVWGVARALPLACTCVASGATLCYLISAALGPALLALPKWKERLDTWSTKVSAQRDNMISYLIVLRIAPLPPHWVVNVIAPHLGIGIIPFWISTFLGIVGVTVIHTTIGSGLDDMTSADDFHLISWRNVLGLSAVVVGVLIPVGLRHLLKRKVVGELPGNAEAMEDGLLGTPEPEGTLIERGPELSTKKGKAVQQLIFLSDDEEPIDEFEEEEDEILESGPVPFSKDTDSDTHSIAHDIIDEIQPKTSL